MMFLRSLCYTALATLATAQLNLVYQFPPQPYINIENIAVRSSNGQLLLTTVTGPTLYQLNPGVSAPEPLVTLTGPDSMIGIAEVSNDIYIVSAGNFSFGPQVPGGIEGIPGTFSVWSIDLTGPQPTATEIVAIPEASSLNGVTTIKGNKDVVLIADSGLGAVWSVNVKTGTYTTAITSPLFTNSPTNRLGINGIHTQGSLLYFTNSAQAIYGSIPINSFTGQATGTAAVIATAIEGAFDDFALLRNGAAFIATQDNAVSYVDENGAVSIIAGGGNDTTLVSPTSAVIRGGFLYVTTGGLGAPPPQGVSGQVFQIDVSQYLGGWKGKEERRWVA